MTSLNNPNKKTNMVFLPDVKLKEFICGWGAGFTNICILYPMNKLLYRQMMYGVNISKAVVRLHSEGVFFLYRGILPPLCQKTLTMSLMFGVYSDVRGRMVEMEFNPYLAKIIGGFSSAAAESVLLPFQRVQALLCDFKYNFQFKNMFHAVMEIRAKYGYLEYYRGYVPFMLRTCPTNALFFITKEEAQRLTPKIQSPLIRSACEFFSGAVIGCTLSCMFYPVTVAKLTMQRNLGTKFENIVVVLRRIYHERGGKLRYIFYGVPTNVIRAFMSWGILNLAYETIKKIVY